MRRTPLVEAVTSPPAVIAGAYLVGSVPFSNLVAHWRTGRDLRQVGSGTVSGTGLYEIAGFGSLALGGSLDVAKGAVGPLLAGPGRPLLAALSGAAGVAGHNWSIFLGGHGGRGISPAIGALLVGNWPGAVVLLGGLAVGRTVRQTALTSLIADGLLVPVLAATRGRRGAAAGATIVIVLVAKRLVGNRAADDRRVYGYRLLFDRDTRDEVAVPGEDRASSSHHQATPASPGPV
jgi:glycerol-3-phosphate acyltransferase PlsY